MASGAYKIRNGGWTTPYTGNFNFQFCLLPAALIYGAVAANSHFKMARWTLFAGSATGVVLNWALDIGLFAKKGEGARVEKRLLNLLSTWGCAPLFFFWKDVEKLENPQAFYKAFPGAHRLDAHDPYEGTAADGVADVLDKGWADGAMVEGPLDTLYKKLKSPAAIGYGRMVLRHWLCHADEITDFDLVKAKEGFLGEHAMRFVSELSGLIWIKVDGKDVQELLELETCPDLLITSPNNLFAQSALKQRGFQLIKARGKPSSLIYARTHAKPRIHSHSIEILSDDEDHSATDSE